MKFNMTSENIITRDKLAVQKKTGLSIGMTGF